jgi:hypothetical protein
MIRAASPGYAWVKFIKPYKPIQFDEPEHLAGVVVEVRAWLAEDFIALGYAIPMWNRRK